LCIDQGRLLERSCRAGGPTSTRAFPFRGAGARAGGTHRRGEPGSHGGQRIGSGGGERGLESCRGLAGGAKGRPVGGSIVAPDGRTRPSCGEFFEAAATVLNPVGPGRGGMPTGFEGQKGAARVSDPGGLDELGKGQTIVAGSGARRGPARNGGTSAILRFFASSIGGAPRRPCSGRIRGGK